MRWAYLGQVEYANALALQRRLRDGVVAGEIPETLLLLEHSAVVTLGRRGTEQADLRIGRRELQRHGVPVHRVERGGLATYHGPGQLIGYPILRLGGRGVGVARFVFRLGEALAGWCGRHGVPAGFDLRSTGVFCATESPSAQPRKLAAIGIHVRRGVAIHGFALNLTVELEPFSAWIVACGDKGASATSVLEEAGVAPTPEAAAPSIAAAVADALGRTPVRAASDRVVG